MNKDRIKKLESISQAIISEAILEEVEDSQKDFWLINITWVKISSDLSYIDIYVSAFRNENILAKTLAKYNTQIQKRYHRSLEIRKLPKIRYRYDNQWKTGQDVCDVIQQIV